ncbi:MAG: hypothetical protein HY515_00255 [Candidatus Aenigmarchaeota archaeon]|nr:hypothetical protein [Candidatus Aenigmarchaeota archaeon]
MRFPFTRKPSPSVNDYIKQATAALGVMDMAGYAAALSGYNQARLALKTVPTTSPRYASLTQRVDELGLRIAITGKVRSDTYLNSASEKKEQVDRSTAGKLLEGKGKKQIEGHVISDSHSRGIDRDVRGGLAYVKSAINVASNLGGNQGIMNELHRRLSAFEAIKASTEDSNRYQPKNVRRLRFAPA